MSPYSHDILYIIIMFITVVFMSAWFLDSELSTCYNNKTDIDHYVQLYCKRLEVGIEL